MNEELEALRSEVLDYLQTEALFSPAALGDMAEVEVMDLEELIHFAKQLGIR